MTTKRMPDCANVAVFDTRSCAVHRLSAFPKLPNDQTTLKFSKLFIYAQKITSWHRGTDVVFTTVD